MLKNYTPTDWKLEISYSLDFTNEYGDGFSFPCNSDGVIEFFNSPEAEKNYNYCIEHPESFYTFKKLIRHKHQIKIPPHGICSCGREIDLYDEYYGACQCDCGKWYNLFGQELLAPQYWECDPSEEEY